MIPIQYKPRNEKKTGQTVWFDRFCSGGDRREGAAGSLNPHPILRMGWASRSPLPLVAEGFRFLFLLAACTEPLVLSFPPKKKGRLMPSFFFGGDKGSRTPDLLNAIQALSQLSYTPIGYRVSGGCFRNGDIIAHVWELVNRFLKVFLKKFRLFFVY